MFPVRRRLFRCKPGPLLTLAALGVLLSSAGCSKPEPVAARIVSAPLALPRETGPILVLVDRLEGHDGFVRDRAEQVSLALRHFSAQTSWRYLDDASIDDMRSSAGVVYLGLNGLAPPSPEALRRLRAAPRLIVSPYHLADLRKAGIAFEHTEGGTDIKMPPGTSVQYKGQRFPAVLPDFLDFSVKEPAQIISAYTVNAGEISTVPHIVQDGNALFVNGEITFDSPDMAGRGTMLVVCDALEHFLETEPAAKSPMAMLRLEDVSSLTPVERLAEMVHYLATEGIPYGMAVIPDLRVKEQAVASLKDDPKLTEILQWAESHGATVILHGLHHCCSSEGAEGYEFWDHDHQTAIAQDSAEWMRSQITEGIVRTTALGLHPQIWETPHYSASATDYRVISEFFPVAWEQRDPVGWLPWALKRDQYGISILPENLGYVALDGTTTVADQLARARELRVCGGCIAAGFLHPSTIGLDDLRRYVDGLKSLGYSFVDPSEALPQFKPQETSLKRSSVEPIP